MRKEISNQFTEGLMSDLNPINTPNTVLTDNLNGTIITYNGNEFSLQNDRGNYALQHCRLSPNYIPVGIKEFGDILYIVSYNPLDKNVEIGSYPSPLTYASSDLESGSVLTSIIQKNIIDLGLTSATYTELMEKAESIIFNQEYLKLNPGDQYKLTVPDFSKYKYETIDYYILDESSNLHNITDFIKTNSEEYEYVKWTIPGSLAIKPRLAELGVSGINLKYFYILDVNKLANFSFTVRLNVNDPYLINRGIIKDWISGIEDGSLKDIKFKIVIKNRENHEYINEIFELTSFENDNLELGKFGGEEGYDDAITIGKNIEGKFTYTSNEEIITIAITPILSEGIYEIEYDNLTIVSEFNLGDADETKGDIGTELFQFQYLGKTEQKYKERVKFNIVGPKVQRGRIKLFYTVCSFEDIQKGRSGKEIKEWTFGNNTIEFDLSNSILTHEDIGLIKFGFGTSEYNLYETKPRVLITSEIFDDFIKSDKRVYDKEISFEEGISKYASHCNVDYNYNVVENSNFTERSIFSSDVDKFYTGEEYKSFFEVNNDLHDHCYFTGTSQEGNINIRFNQLNGKLWGALYKDVDYYYKDVLDNCGTISDICKFYKYKTLNCNFITDGYLFDFPKDLETKLNPMRDVIKLQITIKDQNIKVTAVCGRNTYEGSGKDEHDDNFPTNKDGSLVRGINSILDSYPGLYLMEILFNSGDDLNSMLVGTCKPPTAKNSTVTDYSWGDLFGFRESDVKDKKLYYLVMKGYGTKSYDSGLLGQIITIPFCENEKGVVLYKNLINDLLFAKGGLFIPHYNYQIQFSESDDVSLLNDVYYQIKLEGAYGIFNNSFINSDKRMEVLKDLNLEHTEILEGDCGSSLIITDSFKVNTNIELDPLVNFSNVITDILSLNNLAIINIKKWEESPIQNRFSATGGYSKHDVNLGNSFLSMLKLEYPITAHFKDEIGACGRISKGIFAVNGDYEINSNGRNFVCFGSLPDCEEDNYIMENDDEGKGLSE